MKRYLIITGASVFMLAGTIASLSFTSRKQECNSDELYQQTLKRLSSFSLLKDYRIYLKNRKKSDPVETVYYPITLNRGVQYKFLSAESSELAGKLVISLYTVRNAKPDFLFATNYMKDIDKIYESIEFQSESTMNCLIAFSFKDGKEGCGVGISSFLKN
jgi:hypothetical protein